MKLSRWPWILLILGLMVSPAVADESPVTFHPYAGDVSKDAYLDARDALAVLQYSVGLIAFDPDQERAGDTNGDGSIDAGDALIVLQTSVGVQDPLDWTIKDAAAPTGPAALGMRQGLSPCFPVEPDPDPVEKQEFASLDALQQYIFSGQTDIPTDQFWRPDELADIDISGLWSLGSTYGYTVTRMGSEYHVSLTFLPDAGSVQQALRTILPPADTAGAHLPLLWAQWEDGTALVSQAGAPVAVFMVGDTAAVVQTEEEIDLRALLTSSTDADKGAEALFGWRKEFSLTTPKG